MPDAHQLVSPCEVASPVTRSKRAMRNSLFKGRSCGSIATALRKGEWAIMHSIRTAHAQAVHQTLPPRAGPARLALRKTRWSYLPTSRLIRLSLADDRWPARLHITICPASLVPRPSRSHANITRNYFKTVEDQTTSR